MLFLESGVFLFFEQLSLRSHIMSYLGFLKLLNDFKLTKNVLVEKN